ncbi:MAG: hypothetical protein ABL984_11965 [Pyrinomonadaceae bacterium]
MSFATAAKLTETENMIKYILNATQTWGGAIADGRRLAEAVTRSRVYGTIEVVKAIAENPQHGYWGELADFEDLDHDDLLPAYLGKHGIPRIIPFPGGPELTGKEADPDEIDSYRNDTISQFASVAHNVADENDMPSPVSLYWSIVNSQLKFTGHICEVPMVIYPETDVASRTPEAYLPTIVKLAPLWNLKEGDNLVGIAQALVAAGNADLDAIRAGGMQVSPVSDIMEVQERL